MEKLLKIPIDPISRILAVIHIAKAEIVATGAGDSEIPVLDAVERAVSKGEITPHEAEERVAQILGQRHYDH